MLCSSTIYLILHAVTLFVESAKLFEHITLHLLTGMLITVADFTMINCYGYLENGVETCTRAYDYYLSMNCVVATGISENLHNCDRTY